MADCECARNTRAHSEPLAFDPPAKCSEARFTKPLSPTQQAVRLYLRLAADRKNGLNVVFSRHTITLGVYTHLYARADHAATARQALETSYAAMASGAS